MAFLIAFLLFMALIYTVMSAQEKIHDLRAELERERALCWERTSRLNETAIELSNVQHELELYKLRDRNL